MSGDSERKYVPPEIKEQGKREFAPPGWMTRGALAAETGKAFKSIDNIVTPYRTGHPGWFKIYPSARGASGEYFAPELADIVRKEVSQYQAAPEGWQVLSDLSDKHKVYPDVIKKIVEAQRQEHPEWFVKYIAKNKKVYEHFSPELVKIIEEELSKRQEAPKGWVSTFTLSKEIKRDAGVIKSFANKYRETYPEWFKEFKTKTWMSEHYSPELADIIREKIKNLPPDQWQTSASLSNKIKKAESVVKEAVESFRQGHPEWFREFTSRGGVTREHYSPELVKKITEELSQKVPEGWMTYTDLYKVTGRGYGIIYKVASSYKEGHPYWFKEYRTDEGVLEHLSPELAKIIVDTFAQEKEVAPGWVTRNALVKETKRNQGLIQSIADKYRTEHPEWFRMLRSKRGLLEHFSPELAEEIRGEFQRRAELGLEVDEAKVDQEDRFIDLKGESWVSLVNLLQRYPTSRTDIARRLRGNVASVISTRARTFYKENEAVDVLDKTIKKKEVDRNVSSGELRQFLKDVVQGQTPESQEFAKLISLFGSANAIDILYKFHPKYRRLSSREVKSILSDYLGDFLYRPRSFDIENFSEVGIAFLEDKTFREYLFEISKKDAFAYYSKLRETDKNITPKQAIDLYLQDFRKKAQGVNSIHLTSVLEQLGTYYVSVFEGIQKPSRIVENLGGGRAFPDFAQAINIKELSDKQKLLIADEMGVGKSASAILAKEYLGAPTAVVVVPSNVVDTWVGYLSDKKSSEGKQLGYFKDGQAPRILVIEDISSIENLDTSDYEYILISQEKLNDKYTEELLKANFQMLIVDEVHKLKNVSEGVRSKNILRLAEKIKEKDQYLALLSGTPVPNKVRDLAVVLKLLYPEEFAKVEEDKLVRQIIYSDVLDLRAKLLPRMEMKSLGENVEMPKLTEETVNVELSEIEKDIYQLLLEEDELEATEKIKILRQFLLNPEMLDATPGIPSAKVSKVGKELRETFNSKNKIVMFINGYVESVIRGEDNIVERLGLPPDVEVRIIHGEVSRNQRRLIQEELKQADKKILLLVSGQTADVGVDFSAGEEVFFYNEPWTMAEERQQLARVFRPGLAEDLTCKTFITENTIEEGISLYIQAKQRAIEKLLKGIPRTEIENQLLEEGEKQDAPNLEVNPELARYYFSNWDRMMKIFAYVKQIGEKDFTKFLSKFGQEYAQCYLELGSRSYQANASRISATFIENSVRDSGRSPQDVVILDLASGPEMLKRHILEDYQNRVVSLDINQEHFRHAGSNRVVGSILNVPVRDESVDFANMNFALHYTQFVPSRGKFERLEVLMELNRVLKVGGVGLVNMIYSLDYKDESAFRDILEIMGFEIDDSHSGDIVSGQSYKSKLTVIRKIRNLPVGYNEPEAIEHMLRAVGKENFNGLKLVETKSHLKDTRKIVKTYGLGGEKADINFNKQDTEILHEEQEIETNGLDLKQRYNGIDRIPSEEIVGNGFTRILVKDKYILFKKLKRGDGVVVIR